MQPPTRVLEIRSFFYTEGHNHPISLLKLEAKHLSLLPVANYDSVLSSWSEKHQMEVYLKNLQNGLVDISKTLCITQKK